MRPEYDEDYNHEDDDSWKDAPAVCRCGEVISPFTDLVSEQTGEKVCKACHDEEVRQWQAEQDAIASAYEAEQQVAAEAEYYLSLQQNHYGL